MKHTHVYRFHFLLCIFIVTGLSSRHSLIAGATIKHGSGRNATPSELFRGVLSGHAKGASSLTRKGAQRFSQVSLPLKIQVMTPFREDFESSLFPPSGWTISNPDAGSITWERALGVSGSGSGTGSAWMDFYDYELNPGDTDTLKTPVITGLTVADSIYFDCAYAEYDDPGFGPDSLNVLLSTNGGSTFSVVFADGGSTLATAPSTALPFTPLSSEWETRRIALPPGVAGASVVLAFVAVNGYGNNLYLDNILAGSLPADDIRASGITTPVSGSKQRTSFQPQGDFKNVGTATQANIDVRFQILSPAGSILYNSASTISSLAPGATASVTFPVFAVPSTPGKYTARMIAQDAGDLNPLNDTTIVQFFRPANLAGTFTVGAGGILPTLKAAVDTLVANDVAAPVTFQLVSTVYNESSPLTISQVEGTSAGSMVTFAPAPGISATLNIPGTTEEPYAVGILGSRYIVFDGSPPGNGPAASSLTVNATGIDGTVGFLIAGTEGRSSSYSSVKNLSIRTAADSTTSSSGYYGVLVVGADSAQRDSSVSISGCDISRHGQAGIAVQNTFGLVVDGCSIHDWVQSGGFTDVRGIWLSSYATTTVLSNNSIHNIGNAVNGWWAYGIQQSAGAGSNLLCFNTMISGVGSTGAGTDQNLAAGISVSSFLSSGDRYVHNSIDLHGNDGSSSSVTRSAAFEFPSPMPSGLKMCNNIFSNGTTFNAAGTHAFALYTPATSWLSTDTSNHNNLHATGAQSAVGYFNGSACTALLEWQSATGQDAASVSGDPQFVSSSDLHVSTGSSIVSNIGSPLASIGQDIDGEARNLLAPDIGADEFSSSHVTIGVPLSSGWNMLSNPVVRATGADSVRQLYPGALFPYAFYFSGAAGYQQAYTMQPGTGYWEKFSLATTAFVGGDTRSADSISVQAGWNMVGSISPPIDTSSITSVPPGIRSSLWFGYSGGYSPSAQISPGRAYWVKASSPGMFIFSDALEYRIPSGSTPGLSLLNELTVSDENENMQSLFFGASDAGFHADFFEMPPAPPGDAFDVRFVDGVAGSMVRTHPRVVSGTIEFPLDIHCVSAHIVLRWDVKQGAAGYQLRYGEGSGAKRITLDGKGSRTIVLASSSLTLLVHPVETSPVASGLIGNFPNPFNPSTTIRFGMSSSGIARMEVYNVLGQRVRLLLEEALPRGLHEVVWDGLGPSGMRLGSGVYFVRFFSDDGRGNRSADVLKLMMMK